MNQAAKKKLFVKTLQCQRKLRLHVRHSRYGFPAIKNRVNKCFFQSGQRTIGNSIRVKLFGKRPQKLKNPPLTNTVLNGLIIYAFSAGNAHAKPIKIKFVAGRTIAVGEHGDQIKEIKILRNIKPFVRKEADGFSDDIAIVYLVPKRIAEEMFCQSVVDQFTGASIP